MTSDLGLNTRLQKLKGIGDKYGKRLDKMGLKTAGDVLYHFPRRYQDFSDTREINRLSAGETVSIQGKIGSITSRRARSRRLIIVEAVVSDETGSIKVVWFNKGFLVDVLAPGTEVVLAGTVERDRGELVFKSPEYEKIKSREAGSRRGPLSSRLLHTGRIVPVYEETYGVSSRFLRWLIYHLFKQVQDVKEWLPSQLLYPNTSYPVLPEALWHIHFPENYQQAKQAKKRFEFEQLFLLQLAVLQRRQKLASRSAPSIPLQKEVLQDFLGKLPFELTKDQKIALWEILADMQKAHPMNRLLNGDVGTGKTVVAAVAAQQVIREGHQVAVMAPTEVLARQHFETLQSFFERFNVQLELLVSSDTPASKNEKRERIKQGEVDIAVGTHALLHKTEFRLLGLVVVDEQHRFGVRQRHQLLAYHDDYEDNNNSNNDNDNGDDDERNRGEGGNRQYSKVAVPHYLTMTATPIPRTVGMSVYGDLDISVLQEFPSGKRDLQVNIVDSKHSEQAYEFLRKKLSEGSQAFVVVPVIKKSESIPGISTEEVFEEFQVQFPKFRVGLVHGRLPAEEKERTLRDFTNKKLDILVSTTVVEVGVDVPEANIMLVKGAERFGLAQLHQLGGRIGRRGQKAYLLLMPQELTSTAKRRLEALTKIKDGFELAEEDLKLRGPGEFLGEKQSGWPDFAFEALKDLRLVKQSRQAAEEIMDQSPDLSPLPKLQSKLREFNGQVHLE